MVNTSETFETDIERMNQRRLIRMQYNCNEDLDLRRLKERKEEESDNLIRMQYNNAANAMENPPTSFVIPKRKGV